MKVYFITAPEVGMVKIGKTSRCPQQRFSAMQSGSPVALRLRAVIEDADEPALHAQFDKFRSHGEWFWVRGELADFMAGLPAYQMVPRGRAGWRKAA